MASLKEILTREVFKKFIKHFAPRRFNYTYAVNVLKFRPRKNQRLKKANIICLKKGNTKRQYLNPIVTKKGIKWSIPNYTRAKKWKLPPRKFPRAYSAIMTERNYWRAVSLLKKAMPAIDFAVAKRMVSWFFKEREKPRKTFTTKKSVYEELSTVLDSEIQACANKLKNLTIKEAKI